MEWYIKVLKNYAVFTGRARRKEFWMFFLFNAIFSIALAVVGSITHLTILGNLYSLAVLVPGIAVGIRRMHDTDHRGWWLLFPIVNLIFAVSEGNQATNRFGSDPKASGAPVV